MDLTRNGTLLPLIKPPVNGGGFSCFPNSESRAVPISISNPSARLAALIACKSRRSQSRIFDDDRALYIGATISVTANLTFDHPTR